MIAAVAKRAVTPRLVQNAALWSKVPARNIYPQTSSNHVAGMPRNKIPFPEKVAGGVLISSMILATPVWILTHLNDYKGGDAE